MGTVSDGQPLSPRGTFSRSGRENISWTEGRLADNERITCRLCVHGSKKGKDKKPLMPGLIYCDFHRKEFKANYSCGQAKSR